MDSLVLNHLSTLDSTLSSLTKSLTTTNTFTNAVSFTNTLFQTDDSLTSALSTLHTHQRNYARILHLRAEAAALEQRLKDVIRTCGRFRSEIETVHVGILQEDSDDDGDDDGHNNDNGAGEVDYSDLLQLASRIATYNTSAARDAASLLKLNGHSTDPGEVVNAAMNAEIAHDRAVKGMAFPAGDILRLGALGRLQVLREQMGEEAVEREVETIVRASEGGGTETPLEMDVDMEVDEKDVPASTPEVPRKASVRRQSATAPRPTQNQAQVQERKKLSLDMWDEDDEDDDD